LLVVGLTAAIVAIACFETKALQGLERQTVDARFALRGEASPDPGIVIVAVDHKATRWVNERPPIPRHHYADLLDFLHAADARLIGLDVLFSGKTTDVDDRALLAAIARNGPVLLGTEDDEAGVPFWPAGNTRANGAVLGSTAIDTDSDRVLRRMMYLQVATGTFAVHAAELLRHRPVSKTAFSENHAWIDFRGPARTFPTYSLADVLTRRVPARAFSGKTVLVGVTDPVGGDLWTTSMSSTPMPGVEVQANALATILDGFPLRSADPAIDWGLMLVLAALAPALALRLPGLYVFAAGILAVLGYLIVAQLAFNAGLILRVSEPLVALSMGVLGAIAVDAFVQRRQLRNLQEFFDLLPSPVADFFLSYRRSQSELAANTLREALVRRFGKQSVFMDTESNEAGEAWSARIEEAIHACRAMLVIIGPQWLDAMHADGSRRLDAEDDWVRFEIEAGLARPEIALVPVLHDGAEMPSKADLPPSLAALTTYQAVHLTGRDLDRWIEDLAQSIQRGRLRHAPRPPLTAGSGQAR
jgi:CHASE2 domain-containing sensor protein